jgi:hypothetical protein
LLLFDELPESTCQYSKYTLDLPGICFFPSTMTSPVIPSHQKRKRGR